MTRPVRLAAALIAAALLPPAPASCETWRLVADAFDGLERHESWEIVVESGRIVSAGPARPSAGSGAERAEAPAILTPGLVDLDARLGMTAGAENHEIVATDLLLADGFAPDAAERESLRRSGVTLAWLMGPDSVVVAGAGALVQPAAFEEPPDILRRRWGCSASLASAARQPERSPTSLPDQALALQASAPAIEGPLRIRFDDGASARHAARLGIPVGIPARMGDLAELRSADALVLSRDWSSLRPDDLSLVAALFAATPPLRIGLGSGPSSLGPAALKLAAARLAEAGASPDAILRALTADAAAILGDPARGRIAPGAPADLVLWSGHPAHPGSRPIRVWIAGEEIYRAP